MVQSMVLQKAGSDLMIDRQFFSQFLGEYCVHINLLNHIILIFLVLVKVLILSSVDHIINCGINNSENKIFYISLSGEITITAK